MEASDPVVYCGCRESDAQVSGAGKESCRRHGDHADKVLRELEQDKFITRKQYISGRKSR